MKYTNAHNLPEPLVKAIIADSYSKGESDYSITELISPPRLVELVRKHYDEIVVDVSDELYRLYGKIVHKILEDAGVPERRWAMNILGRTISGKPDRFHDGVVEDWKFTTAWRFKGGTVPVEFEQQLNGYAELMRENGFEVRELVAHGILRDWSKLEMFRNPDYPRQQIVRVPVRLWSRAECQLFLRNRVVLHEKAKQALPECTKEERWAKADEFAVIKKGNKRATRVLANEAAAEQHISQLLHPSQYHIVRRDADSIRCKAYCKALAFCSQGQEILKKEDTNEGEQMKTISYQSNPPKNLDLSEMVEAFLERLKQGGPVELRLQGVELKFGGGDQNNNHSVATTREPAPTCGECRAEKVPSKRGTGFYCVECWKRAQDER